jgi:DNA repair protein RecN (Recombination protein N)
VLREIHITGLGVIDDLDLELHPGLNVLTGETGAGKTLVTVGLSLALGARASSTLVREGSKAAKIQARFEIDPARMPELSDRVDEGELILARVVGADAKGSSKISGELVTTSVLAQVGATLVEVHGQNQAQRLISAATQTAFLDRFAGDEQGVAVLACAESYAALRQATAALDRLKEAARDRERELDLLAYQVREIESVDPRVGESDDLKTEEVRLSHVEKLQELTARAEDLLEGEDGALEALGATVQALDDAASVDDTASELASRSRAIAAEATELVRDVRHHRDGLQPDPERLQEVRERLGALGQLRRKYGEDEGQVLEFLNEANSRVQDLSRADERTAELEEEVAGLEERLGATAARVSNARAGAAPSLAAAIAAELRELGMPDATIEIRLRALPEIGAAGAERAEMLLSPGTGQASAPLAKIASGGELSRTMLACRSVMSELDEVPTIVFDEVDAGIGGQAGLAVGRRLAKLAATRQVLVVTHLPQIACFADRHVRVRKDSGTATIEVLDEAERPKELSRMLAGLDDSATAASHAEELLAAAAKDRATL